MTARLLGADEGALLSGTVSPLYSPEATTEKVPASAPLDGTLFGQFFESLVTQSVRVYAQAHEAIVRHPRLHDGGHEVDLIVERPDHRVFAIEVKLSATIDDNAVKHLNWLQKKLWPVFNEMDDGFIVDLAFELVKEFELHEAAEAFRADGTDICYPHRPNGRPVFTVSALRGQLSSRW